MKNSILILILISSIFSFAGTNGERRTALKDGAMGRYVYTVVDDMGQPVAGAQAHVWFKSYGRPQDNSDWVVETDTNGMFMAEHRFNEKMNLSVFKEGYYRSREEINYLAMPELPVKDGKWQPYGEGRKIVLKRILNPHPMLGPVRPPQRKITIFDEWLGFDLERCDFLPPMGVGKEKDVLIRFRSQDVSRNDWLIAMDVSFTNHPYAGAYRLKKDTMSEMCSVYQADTNAVYETEFSFRVSRVNGASPCEVKLQSDEYLVFRTRTNVDKEGRLLSARYGKLYGPWHFEDAGGSRIAKSFMNALDNDIDLEDMRTLENSRRIRR